MTEKANAGGAATTGGVSFQALVAAWMGVRCLAETGVSPLWGLAEDVVFTSLRAEVAAAVDDLLLTTSHHGRVFIQCKTQIELSDDPASTLGSCIDQAVRLHLSLKSAPLDRTKDRIIFGASYLTGPLRTLHRVLNRMRDLGAPPDTSACVTNKPETEALDKAITLVRHYWLEETKSAPSWDDIRSLLQSIWIGSFDLEADGAEGQLAKALLRTVVLRDAGQAEQAWALLSEKAINLAKTKSGMSRGGLQQLLLGAQVQLRSVESFRADIEQLRGHTKRSLRTLARFAQLAYDGREVRIVRACEKAVRDEAEQASLLVIGEAGCGKSGLLSALAQGSVDEGRDVLLLNVWELASTSMGTLSAELRLKHDLVDVLEEWQGAEPAFLIIDALDGARDEKMQAMYRYLVDQVAALQTRWRVVATIRKFDLQHGQAWRRIMPGTGIRPFFDPAFDNVRHVNVAKLSDMELDSLKTSAPDLHSLVASAPPKLAELVRVPFNLMLVNDLRMRGGAHDLAAVRTQLQLLDLFWEYRLGGPADRIRHERTLTEVLDAMVKTRRLEAPAAVASSADSLKHLLTEGVLVARDDAVQFQHHILFDYAVERLMFRPDRGLAISRLETDRDLVIAVGPSLRYWLEGLWERDASRASFWQSALALVASQAPSIAKIVGGSVAATKLETLDDARPLLDGISSAVAEKLFGFAADAVRVSVESVGRRSPNGWFSVIDEAAQRGTSFITHRASYLLHDLLDMRERRAQDVSREELEHAGRAARRMLRVAWSAPQRFRPAVVSALRAVSRTFASDIDASVAVLDEALGEAHLKSYGHEELQWMAREVARFVGAPAFLARLYDAAFGLDSVTDEPTEMSTSRIFGFRSTVRQDIEASHYILVKDFPAVAKADLVLAAKISVRLAEHYMQKARVGDIRGDSTTFRFQDREGRLVPDLFAASSGSGDERQIVEAFASELAEVAHLKSAAADAALAVLVRENTTALVWRAVIAEAAESEALFAKLRELLVQRAFLLAFPKDLIRWIERYRTQLSSLELVAVATQALALRDDSLGDVAAVRLLRAIGPNSIPDDAKAWLDGQEKEIAERLAEFPRSSSPNAVDEDFDDVLLAGGSPLEARSRGIAASVARLDKNSPPSVGESIVAEVHALAADLAGEKADDGLRARAWGVIAEAATKVAILGRDDVLDVLLVAAGRSEPAYDEAQEEHFARGPSWGGGQARIEATRGLLALATRSTEAALTAAVRRLASDRVGAVRYQIARDLDWLAAGNKGLFWELYEQLLRDKNDGVVGALFPNVVRKAFRVDREREIALLLFALKNSQDEGRGTSVLQRVATEVLAQYVWTGDERLEALVNAWADSPGEHAETLGRLVMSVRVTMTYQDRQASDSSGQVRLRAIAYVRRVVGSALRSYTQLLSAEQTDEVRRVLRAVASVLVEAAQELYFASLAHERDGAKVDPAVRRRFYGEARDILASLAEVGFAASAHYLVQTLSSFVDLVDPVDVFLLIGETIRAGRKGGYQYESLGVKEVVAVVRRYLADYRVIFVDSPECRATLREVLDTFVDAGWSETHHLVYTLDSIFR